MNAIKENTVVFPKMKADQSGVVKGKYSNIENYGDSNTPLIGLSPSEMVALQQNGGTSSGSNTGSSALGWFDSVSGFISGMFADINGAISNRNQKQWGTDAYNQRMAAEANAQAAANAKQKNTGLWIAIAVVALLVIVGFALLISKKK